MSSDTKTIDQFLAENPDVDVSHAWERCWGILSDIKARIATRFPGTQPEANCADRTYYTSPNGEFEGSMQAWSAPGCDWLINYDIHWNPVRIIQRFGRIRTVANAT